MKNYIIISIAVFILVISFLIFTKIPLFNSGYTRLKNGVGPAAGIVLNFISKPVAYSRGLFDRYLDLINVERENLELKRELDELRLKNQRLVELERENKRLKDILNMVEKHPSTMIVARITGEDIKNWFKSIIIDKGRKDGLKERMPVITPKGIVGQIVEVNRGHSKVMVLNDANSCVDTYVEGKETRGILEGKGETTLLLKYVLKTDDITVGDKLITSGKDGIYPKNLYAGIVISIDRQRPGIFSDIEVMPFNNFKRLEEVIILKPE